MAVRPFGIALIQGLLLLSLGCVSLVEGPLRPLDEPIELKADEGVLIIETESNELIRRLTDRSDDPATLIRIDQIPKGRHRHLLVVPAGDYRWRSIELTGVQVRRRHYPYIWDLDSDSDHWSFSVRAGVTNYPGLIYVRREKEIYLTSFTMNRSGQLAAQLQSNDSWLLTKYPMRYSGRVRDDFLEFYSSRVAAKVTAHSKGIEGDETDAEATVSSADRKSP
jgi:hypothetical protein